jgi:ribose transport system substrate-binding protein
MLLSLVAMAALLAACGGSDSTTSDTGGGVETSGSSGNSGGSDQVASAKAALTKALEPSSTWTGPKTSPPAASGKKVAVISCSQASNCAVDTEAAVEAAERIGWQATIFDAKGNPAAYNSSMRNAVNAGYDGIVNISLPTDLSQDGLRYAKKHDVPVVSAADIEVEDPLVFGSVPHQWAEQGQQLGDFLVAESDGKAKVLILRDDEFPGVKIRQDEVTKKLEECEECELLETINMTIEELTNPANVEQQVQSALSNYGDELEYIVAPFGTVDGLVAPALRAQGATDVKILGYDGNEQQVALCNEGVDAAIAVTLLKWTGWAGIDQLNRAFNGEPAVNQNVPAFLATSETCPESGFAEDASTFDFESEFEKLWGV